MSLPPGFLAPHTPLPGAVAGFGTRQWTAPDKVEVITRLGPQLGEIAWLKQVHGAEVITATTGGWQGHGDALITATPGVWIAVNTADCVPLLLAGPGVVAAVHAGWKSTAAGLVPRVIARLREEFGVQPCQLHGALGPCLRPAHFEADADFPAKFAGQHGLEDVAEFFTVGARPGKVQADLPGLVKAQAEAAGIPAEQLQDVGLCTYAAPADFHSWRRHCHAQARGEAPAYATQMNLIRLA